MLALCKSMSIIITKIQNNDREAAQNILLPCYALWPLHTGCVVNKQHKKANCLDATCSDQNSPAATRICDRNTGIQMCKRVLTAHSEEEENRLILLVQPQRETQLALRS